MPARLLAAVTSWRLTYSLPVRVALHSGLWALFATHEYFNTLRFLGEDQLDHPFLVWGFVGKETLAALVGFYFFSWVVLPRWLLRRRWVLTVVGLAAIYYTWALLSFAFFALADYLGAIQKAPATSYFYRILDKGLWTGVFSWYGISIGLNDFSTVVMPALVVRFVQFLLVSSNRSLRLQRENLHLEINFLKAQVNPHFLFNTLNNLYTMLVKQDERAPAVVQHLTDLMHYTVYESNAPHMPLPQELAFLEAYLALERLRYGQKVRITYQLTGDPTAYSITPLLFFPFVENAFKHGVDSSLDASWVEIALAVVDEQLHFAVRNSFSPTAPQRAYGGVGIANVRKRLALHYRPHEYHLTIQQTADTYEVALSLRLSPATTAPTLPSSPTL